MTDEEINAAVAKAIGFTLVERECGPAWLLPKGGFWYVGDWDPEHSVTEAMYALDAVMEQKPGYEWDLGCIRYTPERLRYYCNIENPRAMTPMAIGKTYDTCPSAICAAILALTEAT